MVEKAKSNLKKRLKVYGRIGAIAAGLTLAPKQAEATIGSPARRGVVCVPVQQAPVVHAPAAVVATPCAGVKKRITVVQRTTQIRTVRTERPMFGAGSRGGAFNTQVHYSTDVSHLRGGNTGARGFQNGVHYSGGHSAGYTHHAPSAPHMGSGHRGRTSSGGRPRGRGGRGRGF